MIICIDYDDTIVRNHYPEPGELKPSARYFINKLYDAGHEIIIWTCRMDEPLVKAKAYLDAMGVKYHKINEHMPRLIEQYGNDTRKIYADLYVDDKQLGGLPDTWEDIYRAIEKHAMNFKE